MTVTLNVQDDTGRVANANAYISVADFRAYHTARNNSLNGTPTDDQCASAIIKATAFVDMRFQYRGSKTVLGGNVQLTKWPRIDVLNDEEELVQGVPPSIKNATAEYALRALVSGTLAPDPTYDETGAALLSSDVTVGPIREAKTFAGSGQLTMPNYPIADRLITSAGLTLRGNATVRA